LIAGRFVHLWIKTLRLDVCWDGNVAITATWISEFAWLTIGCAFATVEASG
jgi:hypothetical protein